MRVCIGEESYHPNVVQYVKKEAPMSALRADDVYERYVKPLPNAERLRLLALLAGEVATHTDDYATRPKLDIMGLHGLGKEIWQGVDIPEYIERLRSEWDEPR